MKYHKKLNRTDLLKYGWKTILMMAASEFSRASNLSRNGGGKELKGCLLRAKELLGVIEIDPSIPQAAGIKLAGLANKLIEPSRINLKTLYNQSMSLAS